MYKLLSIVKNVDYFVLRNEKLLIKDKNGVNYLNGNELDGISIYGWISDTEIEFKRGGKYFRKDLLTSTEIELPKFLMKIGLSENGGYFNTNRKYHADLNYSTSDLNYYDFKSKTINLVLSNSCFMPRIADKQRTWMIGFCPKTTLKSLSLLTGEYEWEVDLGKYCQYIQDNELKNGGINQIIGINKQVLWVVCAEGRQLVGIDVNTGGVLHTLVFEELSSEITETYFRVFPPCYLSGDTLICCAYKYYFEVCLDTLSLRVLHTVPFEWKNYSGISMHTLYSGLIYFTYKQPAPGDMTHSWLAVYEPENNRILWKYELGNVTVNQPPQVSADKLYVLSAEGTLFVFEK